MPGSGTSRASTSSAVCTSTMLAGASPVVPSTSSWPAWPIRHDRVALLGELARLDVDLGHQGAGGVDRAQAPLVRVLVDLRGDAVSGEDDQRALRDLGLLLDEDRAPLGELLDDVLVVDDLLADVHGRPVQLQGLLDRLHGPIDAGAVAARRGQQHAPRDGARRGSRSRKPCASRVPGGSGRAQGSDPVAASGDFSICEQRDARVIAGMRQ